jgi:hypothetical protein
MMARRSIGSVPFVEFIFHVTPPSAVQATVARLRPPATQQESGPVARTSCKGTPVPVSTRRHVSPPSVVRSTHDPAPSAQPRRASEKLIAVIFAPTPVA